MSQFEIQLDPLACTRNVYLKPDIDLLNRCAFIVFRSSHRQSINITANVLSQGSKTSSVVLLLLFGRAAYVLDPRVYTRARNLILFGFKISAQY